MRNNFITFSCFLIYGVDQYSFWVTRITWRYFLFSFSFFVYRGLIALSAVNMLSDGHLRSLLQANRYSTRIDNSANDRLIVLYEACWRMPERPERGSRSRYSLSEFFRRFLVKNRYIIVAQSPCVHLRPTRSPPIVTLCLRSAYNCTCLHFRIDRCTKAAATEARYIRFASDYICNRDAMCRLEGH